MQRKGYDGHMGGGSICALADRFRGIGTGSDSRLRKESMGVGYGRCEREERRLEGRLLKSNCPKSVVTSATLLSW